MKRICAMMLITILLCLSTAVVGQSLTSDVEYEFMAVDVDLTINGNVTISNQLEVRGNGTLTVEGNLINNGTINISESGSLIVKGDLTNNGKITQQISGTSEANLSANTIDVDGTIYVQGNSTLYGGTFTADTLEIDGATTVLGDCNYTGKGKTRTVFNIHNLICTDNSAEHTLRISSTTEFNVDKSISVPALTKTYAHGTVSIGGEVGKAEWHSLILAEKATLNVNDQADVDMGDQAENGNYKIQDCTTVTVGEKASLSLGDNVTVYGCDFNISGDLNIGKNAYIGAIKGAGNAGEVKFYDNNSPRSGSVTIGKNSNDNSTIGCFVEFYDLDSVILGDNFSVWGGTTFSDIGSLIFGNKADISRQDLYIPDVFTNIDSLTFGNDAVLQYNVTVNRSDDGATKVKFGDNAQIGTALSGGGYVNFINLKSTIEMGDNAKFEDGSKFLNMTSIKIGDNADIDSVSFTEVGSIDIGDNANIKSKTVFTGLENQVSTVKIGDNAKIVAVEGKYADDAKFTDFKLFEIGDNATISGAVISTDSVSKVTFTNIDSVIIGESATINKGTTFTDYVFPPTDDDSLTIGDKATIENGVEFSRLTTLNLTFSKDTNIAKETLLNRNFKLINLAVKSGVENVVVNDVVSNAGGDGTKAWDDIVVVKAGTNYDNITLYKNPSLVVSLEDVATTTTFTGTALNIYVDEDCKMTLTEQSTANKIVPVSATADTTPGVTWLGVSSVTREKSTNAVGELVELKFELEDEKISVDGGTFEWYLNDTVISDATSSTYSFTPTQIGSNNFKAIFTAKDGIKYVSKVTAVKVVVQPVDQNTVEGQSATFSVTSPDATSYQWYIDRQDGNGFVKIDGATNSTYTTSTLTVADNKNTYYCDLGDGTKTQVATLKVEAKNDTSETVTPVVPDVGSVNGPETGEAGISQWFLIMLGSLACLFVMRKQKQHS